MKMQPTKPREEDIDMVAGLAAGLLAIGVPFDLICERLEIGHGNVHWWWEQEWKRDQDNPDLSRMKCPQCDGGNCTEPDAVGDVTCLDCGYVFDQDE